MHFDAEPIATVAADQALIAASTDYFRQETIQRRDIGVTDDTSLVLPWGDRIPDPGEFYASPALMRLIASHPSDQLGARFGTAIGEIPNSALSGPDQLVVVVGEPIARMKTNGMTVLVSDLEGVRTRDNLVYSSIIIVGGIAMFLPVLILVSIVTEFGAVQRMERFATLRLIGAKPSSVVAMAAAEMSLLALAGSLLGVAIWWILRPVGAAFSIDGTRFFVDDLSVESGTIVLAILFTTVGATLTAAWRINRAGIGPLGASRAPMERAPSPFRLLPVVGGIGLTALATLTWKAGRFDSNLTQLMLFAGFTITGLGILISGPWLTSLCSRWTMRRATSAAGVIAASRIRRHPVATFRAMSGLVLTIFIVSVFAGTASSVLEIDEPEDSALLLPQSTVFVSTDSDRTYVDSDLDAIRNVPGVTAATFAYTDAEMWDLSIPYPAAETFGFPAADGDGWYNTNGAMLNLTESFLVGWEPGPAKRPVGDIPAYILVGTDGSAEAIDRAKTALDQFGWIAMPPTTRADLADRQSEDIANSFSTLAYIGILITTLIASVALTVATAAAILERKRIFGLLRLMGMPTRTMQSIVAFEAVVPLVAVVLFSAGLGWFVAWLIVNGLSYTRSIHMPDVRYFGTIALGLAMAAGSVLVTARFLQQNTTVTQTRFE